MQLILMSVAILTRSNISDLFKYFQVNNHIHQIRRNRMSFDTNCLILGSLIMFCLSAILMDAEHSTPVGWVISFVCVIGLEISSIVFTRMIKHAGVFFHMNALINLYNDFDFFLCVFFLLILLQIGLFLLMLI